MKNFKKTIIALVLILTSVSIAFSFDSPKVDILCDENNSGICCEVNASTGDIIKCWRDELY